MTMQSTPEPERATQDQGTQIPIQDEASDVKQEGVAQQGGAAPEADPGRIRYGRGGRGSARGPGEEAPSNDELVEKARQRRRTGRTNTCACMPNGIRTVVVRRSSASRSASAPVRSWLRSCCPSSTISSAPSTTPRRTGEAGLIDGVKAVHSKFVNVLETGGVQGHQPCRPGFRCARVPGGRHG